jgi:hypothetical protein
MIGRRQHIVIVVVYIISRFNDFWRYATSACYRCYWAVFRPNLLRCLMFNKLQYFFSCFLDNRNITLLVVTLTYGFVMIAQD